MGKFGEEQRWGGDWEKSGVLEHKSDNSFETPQRVGLKVEEKLLWRAYRNSPTLFRTVPSSTPYTKLYSSSDSKQLKTIKIRNKTRKPCYRKDDRAMRPTGWSKKVIPQF